jgi:hypothetical protein
MGIAYLRGPASRAGRLGKNCRPRTRARRRRSPNALNRLNFIFDADCMAEAPWQERRQPAAATRTANVPGHRAAVLAYRPSAKSAAHGAIALPPAFK